MSSKIQKYRGVEITSEEMKSGKYLLTEYETELRYSWSSGVAIGRFLAGLKEGEVWGRKCDTCKRVLVPPRMYCEICFRPNDRWVRLSDTGRVITYSISHVNADASRRNAPIIVGVIEIDGAGKDMGILHLLGEVSPENVSIEMPVKAVWRDAEERRGAITDIMYFKPLPPGGGRTIAYPRKD